MSPFDPTSRLQDTYPAFKGWAMGENGARSAATDREFAAYWKIARLEGRMRILELGFGAGQFLDWASEQGHQVIGVELLPSLVDRARDKGHTAHLGPLRPGMIAEGSLDLVCAFDVLEHLTVEEILNFLKDSAPLFAGPARYLLRFPNAQSPLSARYQFGDATHRTQLSPDLLAQLGQILGLSRMRTLKVRYLPPGPGAALRRWMRYRLQDLIETAIGLAYFGAPYGLDPNAVVLLEGEAPQSA